MPEGCAVAYQWQQWRTPHVPFAVLVVLYAFPMALRQSFFVCIQTPFWDNQGKAVAETHLKRMGDIIHKCGKTAEVQLAPPHDSRRAIAACLWSGFPWHGPDTGEDHMFGSPLLPEFVPSAHRATWHTVTMFHECLSWDEQIRRTAVFYVRHALRFGDYAMAAMSDAQSAELPM